MAAHVKKFRKKKFTQISIYNMYAKCMLKRGLGSKSKKFLRSIIFNIKVKHGDFQHTVCIAFERGRPLTFLKSLTLGGSKYQVPCAVLVQRYML